MTLLASAVQPALVYASEADMAGYEAEYPAFEQVKTGWMRMRLSQRKTLKLKLMAALMRKMIFPG